MGLRATIGTRPWILSAISLAIALCAAGPARADDRAVAREHFDRAEEHYRAADYRQAFAEYEAAYAAAPLPALLFNMGQCQRLLGSTEQALELYRGYLSEVPEAANRAVVEELIAELETSAPPSEPPPESPPPVPPPAAAPVVPITPASPPEPRGGAGPAIGLPTWLVLGAGAIMLVGSGLFQLRVSSVQSDMDDPDLDCTHDLPRCLDLRDEGETAATLRNGFLLGSAAALATAAVLLTLDLSRTPETERAGGPRPVAMASGLALEWSVP